MVETNATRTDGAAAMSSPTPPAVSPDQGKPVVEQARQAAGQMMDQARAQAISQVDTQKERAATGIGSAAQALRQASQHLREQDQAPFAQFMDSAAQQMEQANRFLNERETRQMMWEFEQFARRQPALFLGGAFALGFLAARFFKSSTESMPSTYQSEIASLQPSAYVGAQPANTWAPTPGATMAGPLDEAMSGPVSTSSAGSSPGMTTTGPIGSDAADSEDELMVSSAGSAAETG
jgi:hypothetical protein